MLAEYVHLLSPFVVEFWDGFGIRWYGLAYVIGFVGAYFLYKWLARHGFSDLKESQVGDFIAGAAIFGVLLGGRLGYYLFYEPQVWWRDPLQILRIWEGGMSSHGGMIGLFLYTLFYAERHKVSWTNIGDNLCVVAPIGIFCGRLANFINGELWGRVANVPWAMKFPSDTYDAEEIKAMRLDPQLAADNAERLQLRHPSQIYEALLEGLLLFSVLWFVRTRLRVANGTLTGLFFFLYGIMRIFVEQFREPDKSDPLVWSLTRGQWLSCVLLILGIAFLLYAFLRPNRKRAKAS